MRTIRGRCHCGNIAFELQWPEPDGMLAVRACSCTFCVKHGGVYTSHPDARLRARVADESLLSSYAFGTETAQFFVCRRCGVVPLVTSRIDGGEFAVVNVNTFENVDPSELDATTTDFDGESIEERLARRKHRWIPRVEIEMGKRHGRVTE